MYMKQNIRFFMNFQNKKEENSFNLHFHIDYFGKFTICQTITTKEAKKPKCSNPIKEKEKSWLNSNEETLTTYKVCVIIMSFKHYL